MEINKAKKRETKFNRIKNTEIKL
ncbi:hypothetical protein [Macrococcoides canis]|nr:hypothetical protein [Macrococcus canis]